jgi:cytidylate kinase
MDSGAMYRAVTYFALQHHLIDREKLQVNEKELQKKLDHLQIDFYVDENNGNQYLLLNNKNIEQEIRQMEVSNYVSYISKIDFVREKLVEKQREFATFGGLVMDGRDIGTVVFPGADVKFFVTAKPEIRAKRRFDELQAKGYDADMEQVRKNITERDKIDQNRAVSPLRKAEDAIELDNSNLTRDEQLKQAIEIIEKQRNEQDE